MDIRILKQEKFSVARLAVLHCSHQFFLLRNPIDRFRQDNAQRMARVLRRFARTQSAMLCPARFAALRIASNSSGYMRTLSTAV
jgi:hypothetical protein